ncbi:RNA-binding S4 domain-containing protein [uncultured Azohydromonas sp.]|jgi:Ribosome-associated heat shock protein implicated in the recycling of the 50S subunit (S4 paralog)|uniref:RNA-binding S4 domain-containing protein n=1 Tax=uncultured Azohydromonas sp. TaxID=487342 RepID=UPI002635170F|nr:RNA-binding S4 domain-containing protein [uncultured Azohydromonas sp.]
MIELPLQERVRLDKWLWAARFFKTRGLAAEEIGKNRISVNGQVAKASRELKAGDRVSWRQQGVLREVEVRALSEVRGPAPLAQTLYVETPESLEARRVAAEQRRQGIEPAQTIAGGRPTKRDRRDLEREQRTRVEWDRWSAKLGD